MDTRTQQPQNSSEKIGIIVLVALYVFVFIFRIPGIIFEGAVLIWIQVSVYGLLGIISGFLFRHTLMNGFRQWKAMPLKSILWLLGAYIGGMFAMQIASLPAYLMGAEAPQNDVNVLHAIQTLGLPLSIVILGLAGPVVEEIIYRAFLIRKRKVLLWVVLSSSLFALAHLHEASLIDLVSILPHFSAALVYGAVYASTKNITLPLIIHVMNNTVAVILL